MNNKMKETLLKTVFSKYSYNAFIERKKEQYCEEEMNIEGQKLKSDLPNIEKDVIDQLLYNTRSPPAIVTSITPIDYSTIHFIQGTLLKFLSDLGFKIYVLFLSNMMGGAKTHVEVHESILKDFFKIPELHKIDWDKDIPPFYQDKLVKFQRDMLSKINLEKYFLMISNLRNSIGFSSFTPENINCFFQEYFVFHNWHQITNEEDNTPLLIINGEERAPIYNIAYSYFKNLPQTDKIPNIIPYPLFRPSLRILTDLSGNIITYQCPEYEFNMNMEKLYHLNRKNIGDIIDLYIDELEFIKHTQVSEDLKEFQDLYIDLENIKYHDEQDDNKEYFQKFKEFFHKVLVDTNNYIADFTQHEPITALTNIEKIVPKIELEDFPEILKTLGNKYRLDVLKFIMRKTFREEKKEGVSNSEIINFLNEKYKKSGEKTVSEQYLNIILNDLVKYHYIYKKKAGRYLTQYSYIQILLDWKDL